MRRMHPDLDALAQAQDALLAEAGAGGFGPPEGAHWDAEHVLAHLVVNERLIEQVRNSVAHHARLWMRPTADSAKKPRLFDKRLRGAHPKSMYWAFMNLATFLPKDQRQPFAQRVDDLTSEDPIYRHGITNVHEQPKQG